MTTFRDLREGRTEEGWNVERPAAVMSTAEAVTVAAAITRQGAFFAAQKDPVSLLPGYLLGVVLKDNQEDRDRLLAYWDGPIRRRGEKDALWKRMYELRDVLEEQRERNDDVLTTAGRLPRTVPDRRAPPLGGARSRHARAARGFPAEVVLVEMPPDFHPGWNIWASATWKRRWPSPLATRPA